MPEDVQVLREGIKLALRLVERIKAQGYPITDLYLPFSDTDEDIDAYIRKQGRTTFLYACTCRMAPLEEDGVVDDELMVWGVDGLRVADTSVFPGTIAGYTMGPLV
ncbi:GMC oxidoreductase [Sphaerobolus stellatus SS14]|uniref:GMC oxidoreductase n=1 Tax=Sphaerobolus stellatus (strain SS14) TaxID=990650 RepID=A0A0C9TU90_SPHS4|nr:GMC oxidoreductase [Sphaerobolus stellatus SS14]